MLAVRVARSRALLAAHPDAGALLSAHERRRLAALRRQTDRDDFVAARVLVRMLLVEVVPDVPTDAGADGPLGSVRIWQECATCGGPHGAPHTEGAFLSWAHSSGVVAAAVSDRPVGVDIEPLDAAIPALAGRLRDVAEWVRLEAIVKTGRIDLDGALALPRAELAGVTVADWADPATGVAVAVASVGGYRRPVS